MRLPDLTSAKRVVCWFSCGAASAAATKLAIEAIGDRLPVVVAYCASTLSSEHPDNRRFLEECSAWFERPVEMLYSERYEDTWDVWQKTRWLVGVGGARCTQELKKAVRQRFEDPFNDIQVFGFDASETKRAERFRENNPEARLWAPLIDVGAEKGRCVDMLRRAGIEPPALYGMGYRNNNCIGCVKGQAGYWNKIRIDFPEVFERMAQLERELDVAICKTEPKDPVTGKRQRLRVFLDELPPDAGRYSEEPELQCGVLCGEDGEEQLELFEECES